MYSPKAQKKEKERKGSLMVFVPPKTNTTTSFAATPERHSSTNVGDIISRCIFDKVTTMQNTNKLNLKMNKLLKQRKVRIDSIKSLNEFTNIPFRAVNPSTEGIGETCHWIQLVRRSPQERGGTSSLRDRIGSATGTKVWTQSARCQLKITCECTKRPRRLSLWISSGSSQAEDSLTGIHVTLLLWLSVPNPENWRAAWGFIIASVEMNFPTACLL